MTYGLREYSLQKHLHDQRRVRKDHLNDLRFFTYGVSNLFEELSKTLFSSWWRRVRIIQRLPAKLV